MFQKSRDRHHLKEVSKTLVQIGGNKLPNLNILWFPKVASFMPLSRMYFFVRVVGISVTTRIAEPKPGVIGVDVPLQGGTSTIIIYIYGVIWLL